MLFVCSRLISELSSLYAHNVPNYRSPGLLALMSRSPLDRTTLCNIFLPALVVVTLESCYSRGSQYSSPMDCQVHSLTLCAYSCTSSSMLPLQNSLLLSLPLPLLLPFRLSCTLGQVRLSLVSLLCLLCTLSHKPFAPLHC